MCRQREGFVFSSNHFSPTIYSQYSEQCSGGSAFCFEIGDSVEKNIDMVRHQYYTYK